MDERSRVQAILSDEAAKARTELAQYLAFETDMSVSAAVSLLAKAPCETASRDGVSGFNAAMAAIPNPEISACLEDEDDDAESVAKRLAAY
ncbi:hypothetical protein [Bartonella sp. DGB2]|uniref:hypothetical protein n=1 Tax=Bartonella sp. DGB2 TaxID=3388426 RepID=UPI00398FEBF0